MCGGGDGGPGGDDDTELSIDNVHTSDPGLDTDVAEMTAFTEGEIASNNNTANTDNFDDNAMSALDIISGMQNASLMGHSFGPGGTSPTSAHNAIGLFDEESNEARGNDAQGIVDSYEQAVDDASNISSQVLNTLGLTSHASIDPETGLYGETTGINAGPALSMAAMLAGGPAAYGIGAFSGLMQGNALQGLDPTGIIGKANQASSIIQGAPLIGPQYQGPGLQAFTPAHSPFKGPGLFDKGGALHSPGGLTGSIGRL